MIKRLPPLAALEAFEAAARHGRFSRAAEELNLSHSAVSRQIQKLEHWLGESLFLRNGPRIRLNEAGLRLQQRLAEPLLALEQSLRGGEEGAGHVHLMTLPSMATAWLLPRLARLQAAQPSLQLSVHTAYHMVSLPPGLPALALRYGHFEREGLCVEHLFGERLLAVAPPGLLAQWGERLESWPGRLLLRHGDTPWPERLAVAGGKPLRLPRAEGMEFNDALVQLEACEQGLGIAWTRYALAEARLRAGRLLAVPGLSVDSGKSYWLACRHELADLPAMSRFRAWLIAEAWTWQAQLDDAWP